MIGLPAPTPSRWVAQPCVPVPRRRTWAEGWRHRTWTTAGWTAGGVTTVVRAGTGAAQSSPPLRRRPTGVASAHRGATDAGFGGQLPARRREASGACHATAPNNLVRSWWCDVDGAKGRRRQGCGASPHDTCAEAAQRGGRTEWAVRTVRWHERPTRCPTPDASPTANRPTSTTVRAPAPPHRSYDHDARGRQPRWGTGTSTTGRGRVRRRNPGRRDHVGPTRPTNRSDGPRPRRLRCIADRHPGARSRARPTRQE